MCTNPYNINHFNSCPPHLYSLPPDLMDTPDPAHNNPVTFLFSFFKHFLFPSSFHTSHASQFLKKFKHSHFFPLLISFFFPIHYLFRFPSLFISFSLLSFLSFSVSLNPFKIFLIQSWLFDFYLSASFSHSPIVCLTFLN